MKWFANDPDDLGLLPAFLSERDPRPAREQLDANYGHGGGWNEFQGFRFNPETKSITYPGDSPLLPVAWTSLRDETIYLYEGSWVLILQKDGAYEIARMD